MTQCRLYPRARWLSTDPRYFKDAHLFRRRAASNADVENGCLRSTRVSSAGHLSAYRQVGGCLRVTCAPSGPLKRRISWPSSINPAETRTREIARKDPGSPVAGYVDQLHIVFSMAELVRYVLFRERVFDSRADARRFFVAGFPYHAGPKLIDRLNVGNLLRLVREHDNPHDTRAVAIYYQEDRIGYVPRNQNHDIAAKLDQGKRLRCQITAINAEEDAYDVIEVEVAPPLGLN